MLSPCEAMTCTHYHPTHGQVKYRLPLCLCGGGGGNCGGSGGGGVTGGWRLGGMCQPASQPFK